MPPIFRHDQTTPCLITAFDYAGCDTLAAELPPTGCQPPSFFHA